jgi:hypothetical protein
MLLLCQIDGAGPRGFFIIPSHVSHRSTSCVVPRRSHAGAALGGLLCKLVAAGFDFIGDLLDPEDAQHHSPRLGHSRLVPVWPCAPEAAQGKIEPRPLTSTPHNVMTYGVEQPFMAFLRHPQGRAAEDWQFVYSS